jgi:hypothetical protein
MYSIFIDSHVPVSWQVMYMSTILHSARQDGVRRQDDPWTISCSWNLVNYLFSLFSYFLLTLMLLIPGQAHI